jgi:6-phosphogluconate dehydrogenase
MPTWPATSGGHGVPVAVHNRTSVRTKKFMDDHGDEGSFTAAKSVEELVQVLERPRRILVMVKAGKPVDGVIDYCPITTDIGVSGARPA